MSCSSCDCSYDWQIIPPRPHHRRARHPAVVEQRRDNPAIDRILQTLEGVCGELASGIRENPQVRP